MNSVPFRPLFHLGQNSMPFRCVSGIPRHFGRFQPKLKIRPVWILGIFFFSLPSTSYLTFWPSELLPFTTIYHSFLISIWTIILCFFLTTFHNFLPAQNPHQKKTEVLMEGRAAELTECRERLRMWIMDGYDFKWWRAYSMKSFNEGSWMSLCGTWAQLVIINFFFFWSYHLGCSFYNVWAEQKIKRLGCSTVSPTQRCAMGFFFFFFF